MQRVTIQYKRRDLSLVIVNFHGRELVREVEHDAEQCAHCGVEREERNTAFFSYDDFAWPEVEAFCNLRCYGAFLASGRMSQTRATKLQRALDLVARLDALEARDELAARRAARAA